MKLSHRVLAASLAVAGFVATATSATAAGTTTPGTVRNKVSRVVPKDGGATFSVEVPYVRSFTPPGTPAGWSNTLVLTPAVGGHTFNVTLQATNPPSGATAPGVALPQTDLLGYFSFPALTNNPSFPEVFVKILDGRPIIGNYWVFWGHLTSLPYVLTVTDNVTGASTQYSVPAGTGSTAAPGGFDTGSFPGGSVTATNTKAGSLIEPDAYVRTSIDISNNTTSDGVNAVIQYCYSTGGAFQGCTVALQISLAHYDNFHQNDIVAYLVGQGVLPASAPADSSGTLLVTFENLPSVMGWEGTVTARTYNRVSEVDPLRGTVGCGEDVSLFFDSATASLVGTAVDSVPAPDPQTGSLLTNLGIRNSDVSGTLAAATVTVTLYDPSTGQTVGNPITLSNIQPGELRLVSDLFGAAGVPTNVTSVIVFADSTSPGNATTVDGFLLTQDTNNGDQRFATMKCAAGCPPGCPP
jgi:hypothetical protein